MLASSIQYLFTAVITFSLTINGERLPRRRCAFGDDCWPDHQVWHDFNTTVGGRLIRSVPSAAFCHGSLYDAGRCDISREEWLNSTWRTSQPGSYSALLWEAGYYGKCLNDEATNESCDQGIVPYYAVSASSVHDIQLAVKFAAQRDLYLVVKNTGHDHLGRSSGEGAFSIWTHNLKGINWQDAFIPEGAPPGTPGVAGVTVQPGMQWLEVYQEAAKRNVTIVGGSARTVGAAGGYLLGGGHSPYAHFYGLAADNLLEMSIVSADGRHRVINAYNDPDYFWAVRGGGGSAWGVVTSVTYKTHPLPETLLMGFVQLNTTNDATFVDVVESSLQVIPSITDAGFTGYSDITQGFSGIFILPNGTMDVFNATFAPFEELARLPGVSGAVAAFPSTWDNYLQTFLRDPNIATNIQDTSRLLTAEVLQNKGKLLAELILQSGGGGGFNFIGKVNNGERDNTAIHEIWKRSHGVFSISTNWIDNATAEEKHQKRRKMVNLSRRMTKIVGSDGGTYINEANPYEPNWQQVFWGDKYPRLLSIKRYIDPTNLFVCNRCVGTDIVLLP